MSDIIAVSGKLRHGKDTFANLIIEELKKTNYPKKIYKTAFANPIKEAVLCMFPQIDPHCLYGPSELRNTIIEGYIDPTITDPFADNRLTIRGVLVQLGKWGRSCNTDFWAMATMNSALKAIEENAIVIISDVRFKSEMKYVRQYGGKIIRIVRPDVGFTTTDESEIDLDNVTDFDKVVINDTIDNLQKAAIDVINEYIL